jgi:hypothetical protein
MDYLKFIGTNPTSSTVTNVQLNYSNSTKNKYVNPKTEELIKNIFSQEGIKSVKITSTLRTIKEQAKAMYENCVNNGVQTQYNLYGSKGDKVIDVYVASKKAGLSAEAIKTNMENKIRDILPDRVSNHCVTEEQYAKLNILDISNSTFNSATQRNRVISKLSKLGVKCIYEPKNNCLHIEVPVVQ